MGFGVWRSTVLFASALLMLPFLATFSIKAARLIIHPFIFTRDPDGMNIQCITRVRRKPPAAPRVGEGFSIKTCHLNKELQIMAIDEETLFQRPLEKAEPLCASRLETILVKLCSRNGTNSSWPGRWPTHMIRSRRRYSERFPAWNMTSHLTWATGAIRSAVRGARGRPVSPSPRIGRDDLPCWREWNSRGRSGLVQPELLLDGVADIVGKNSTSHAWR